MAVLSVHRHNRDSMDIVDCDSMTDSKDFKVTEMVYNKTRQLHDIRLEHRFVARQSAVR